MTEPHRRRGQRMEWSEEAIATLLEGYRNAETIDAIAARFGTTRDAVAGKANRLRQLGLLRHRSQAFRPPKPQAEVARPVQRGERTLPLLPSEWEEARE